MGEADLAYHGSAQHDFSVDDFLRADPVTQIFPSSKERLRLRLYSSLVALDIFAIACAFLIGNGIRQGDAFASQTRDMLLLLLPVFLGLALNNRAYSIDALTNPRTGLKRALQALLVGFAVILAILFYLKVSSNYSRVALTIGTVISVLFLSTARLVFGNMVGRAHRWSFLNKLLLVDGVTVRSGVRERVVHADRLGIRPTMDDPVMLDRIGRLLRHADRVILACVPEQRAAWARMLKGMDVDAELLAPELDELGALEMRSSHGKATLLVSCGPLGFRARVMKRLFDLAIAIPALILLAPLMLAAAAAIVAETPGPVLFRQPRVGRGNRIFHVLKFRSMRIDAADREGSRSASREDDRITRVGRFMRRSSIDELPQLINVLKGEMSIVGPRPHALASTAGEKLFWAVDERYLERHIVKPGITGLAQVKGLRGATVTERDLVDRLQADLDYLAGWSLWRDCKILADTLSVLVHRNAY